MLIDWCTQILLKSIHKFSLIIIFIDILFRIGTCSGYSSLRTPSILCRKYTLISLWFDPFATFQHNLSHLTIPDLGGNQLQSSSQLFIVFIDIDGHVL